MDLTSLSTKIVVENKKGILIILKGYLNYWDTTSAALESTNKNLIFGGAGESNLIIVI